MVKYFFEQIVAKKLDQYIQNSMFEECDIVTKGYYLGNPEGWREIPKAIRQEAEQTAKDRWMLLLQLDTVECDDFELMFGNCGHIYFYITKEDLKARHFDNIWLILQSSVLLRGNQNDAAYYEHRTD